MNFNVLERRRSGYTFHVYSQKQDVEVLEWWISIASPDILHFLPHSQFSG